MAKRPPSIPLTEYAARRKKVRTALKNAIGVVFAGDVANPLHDDFRPHAHFEYLTGVVDEPGAVLVLDPGNPVEARREALFLKPIDPEVDKWDGYRDEISSKLRERYGIKSIFRLGMLPRFMAENAHRAKTLGCLHAFAYHTQPVSPDLALFRQIAERIPGISIEDHTNVLPKLRSVKSTAEANMIAHAVSISALAYDAVMHTMRPGMNEFDIQETLEHTYRSNGSRRPGYGTIAGGGINSTVLHYRANDEPLDDGDLICIDSGADFGGYTADITRTFPINGTFTKRQRQIYQIVLAAEEATIKAVKPGVTFAKLDAVARAIITKAGYGDYFIHGIGHNLGLEVHDVTPPGPLKAGNIITIEPGIYIPDEKIGVRIEDNILVTKDGRKNLSAAIPKRAAIIEKIMAEARGKKR